VERYSWGSVPANDTDAGGRHPAGRRQIAGYIHKIANPDDLKQPIDGVDAATQTRIRIRKYPNTPEFQFQGTVTCHPGPLNQVTAQFNADKMRATHWDSFFRMGLDGFYVTLLP